MIVNVGGGRRRVSRCNRMLSYLMTICRVDELLVDELLVGRLRNLAKTNSSKNQICSARELTRHLRKIDGPEIAWPVRLSVFEKSLTLDHDQYFIVIRV